MPSHSVARMSRLLLRGKPSRGCEHCEWRRQRAAGLLASTSDAAWPRDRWQSSAAQGVTTPRASRHQNTSAVRRRRAAGLWRPLQRVVINGADKGLVSSRLSSSPAYADQGRGRPRPATASSRAAVRAYSHLSKGVEWPPAQPSEARRSPALQVIYFMPLFGGCGRWSLKNLLVMFLTSILIIRAWMVRDLDEVRAALIARLGVRPKVSPVYVSAPSPA